ncbi:peptide deformylase [Arthrobacter sedimenti]|uniref:peptide deformylase n=1 Tax=Arthrobacter sedimenti TaxID=2694931 RepID=UPI000B354AD4|nr:peptide deformylase [Arthrobacter sedimenti]OUM39519.1 peptide deformylase [Arthrobacter agilis]
MAVLSIRMIGDPILRTPAAEVTDFGPELARLVEDMTETMIDVQGAGLAAPQVGIGLQVFTYRVDGVQGHVVNPVLEVGGESQGESDVEGCLSVPGLGSYVGRTDWARVTGKDVSGGDVVVEGTGMLARALQHETDHLRGTLYIDRLEGEDRKSALRAIRSAEYNRVTSRTAAQRSRSLGSSFTQGPASGGTASRSTGTFGQGAR